MGYNISLILFSILFQVINSVLVPTVDEESLMAHIMDGEPDYENEEGPNNLWST